MLIDYTLIVAVLALATILARLFGRDARWAGSTLLTMGYLTAILLVVFNFVLLAGFTGRTLGKWVTGLRVRKSDGTTLGFGRAALRHFVGYVLSGLVFGLGFLLAALNAEGRALHDLIAGTVVVRDRREARRTAPR